MSPPPRSRWRGTVLVAPATAWTALFFALPFAMILVVSLWQRVGAETVQSWSLANYVQVFSRPELRQALWNSLEVTALVTLISVLLAYPLAWILAMRVPERWQRPALVLAVLPFWTSYVVRSYAWTLVLNRSGVIAQASEGLGLPAFSLANSQTAVVIAFVHFFVMLLTLTIYVTLRQLPRNYAKAAADLGASPLSTFWLIILPLSLPGVAVGAFLTFLLAMGDYITPEIVGGKTQLLLPQVIVQRIQRGGDLPLASALAVILMLVITAGYLLAARHLKMDRT